MAETPDPRIERALRHLRRDARLRPVIRRFGPPSYRRYDSHFHALARSILFQQLSGSAANTIFDRFTALFPGRRFPRPEQVLALSVEELRAVGVSRQKAGYLLDLAAKMADGTIRPRLLATLSDDELVSELTQVKGIGVWTVHMFALFTLRRPDVLPVGDLGIRKGFERLFELDGEPDADAMVALAEPWRPYRSIASWYLWRVLEMETV
ncbi:MAG TPA: DNA-3-methyladenine glycosylase [Thermoanaerobaculia bacterium]|nr:DNA-3-methyladenine glycosylase [Thermoanaerobaculia bacterium]